MCQLGNSHRWLDEEIVTKSLNPDPSRCMRWFTHVGLVDPDRCVQCGSLSCMGAVFWPTAGSLTDCQVGPQVSEGMHTPCASKMCKLIGQLTRARSKKALLGTHKLMRASTATKTETSAIGRTHWMRVGILRNV